jgi:hypothetical protein
MTANDLQIAVLFGGVLLTMLGSFLHYVDVRGHPHYPWSKGLCKIAVAFTLWMGVLHSVRLLREALAQ